MNETIDKIAEKLGTGIEAARPLAETVVREYAMTHWLISGVCVVLGGLFVVAAVLVVRHAYKKEIEEYFYGGCMGGATGVMLLIAGTAFLMRAMAPHYYVLKDLFGS